MEMFPAAAPHKPSKTLEELEREYIIAMHEAVGGRIEGPDGAAKVLGLHPSPCARMKKLGIQDTRPRPHARSEPSAVI